MVEVDSAPTSCCPSVSENSGIISGIRIASATSPERRGLFATPLAHRAEKPLVWLSGWISRTRSALIRGPRIASTAGSNVSAPSTASTTAIAAISPIVVTKGMPATTSETSAIVTVPPAKNTAPPDVAVARAIDSFIGNPSRRPRKWRVTMNSA